VSSTAVKKGNLRDPNKKTQGERRGLSERQKYRELVVVRKYIREK